MMCTPVVKVFRICAGFQVLSIVFIAKALQQEKSPEISIHSTPMGRDLARSTILPFWQERSAAILE
jgi:hypothetical protein